MIYIHQHTHIYIYIYIRDLVSYIPTPTTVHRDHDPTLRTDARAICRPPKCMGHIRPAYTVLYYYAVYTNVSTVVILRPTRIETVSNPRSSQEALLQVISVNRINSVKPAQWLVGGDAEHARKLTNSQHEAAKVRCRRVVQHGSTRSTSNNISTSYYFSADD